MKIHAYDPEAHIDLSGSVATTAHYIAKTSTSLGSNTPLIESGSGAPGSGPQAAAWDHVHPEFSSGGASAFGSNSTRVASTPSAGASSSNSRTDHVHDGIGTITASSSNSLNRGTFNLRSGTGIALALSNTDGGSGFDTVTIQNLVPDPGGSGIADILDLPTAEMDDTLVLAPDGTGGVEFRAEAGGSGVSWTQDVNQPGTSFASWTSVGGGTWSSNGTEIIQTNTSAVVRSAVYSTMLAMGFPYILEFEAQVSAASGRAGMGLSDTGANSGSLICYIQQGSGVVVEHKGSTVIRTFTTTINTDTWYKVRLVNGSGWIAVYLGGTLLGNVRVSPYSWDTDMDYPALYSYNASTKFRNIKAWTLTGSVPA